MLQLKPSHNTVQNVLYGFEWSEKFVHVPNKCRLMCHQPVASRSKAIKYELVQFARGQANLNSGRKCRVDVLQRANPSTNPNRGTGKYICRAAPQSSHPTDCKRP